MALSFSKTKAGIKRRFYVAYMRETGTAVAAGDYDTLAHWNTFLALFTAIGYLENQNVKIDLEPDPTIEIDSGEIIGVGYKASLEFKFLQSAVADDTALADMAGKDVDILLADSTNKKFVYIHNKRCRIAPKLNSGEVEHTIISHEQHCSAITDYLYTRAAIPTS